MRDDGNDAEETERAELFPDVVFCAAGSNKCDDELVAADGETMEGKEEIVEACGVIERWCDDYAGQAVGVGETGSGGLDEGADIDLAETVGKFRVGGGEMVGDGPGRNDDIGAANCGRREKMPVCGN